VIKNKKLKNRGNLVLKAMPLIYVKVKIKHGQGLGLGLGLRLDAEGEDLIKNKELIKQAIPIPVPRIDDHRPYLCREV
jgi:hypothetical protein